MQNANDLQAYYRSTSLEENMCIRIEEKSCMFYILSFTFLCTALAVQVDPSELCPPSELTDPCTCRAGCGIPWCVSIECENITDQQVLTRVFTTEYQFARFTLKHASVRHLPDSLFQVRRNFMMIIEDSSFVSLMNDTTIQGNSIDSMILDKVQFSRGFDFKILSGFHHLIILNINRAIIPRIDQSFVDHAPKSLKVLQIDDCSTTTIHDRAFAGSTRLSVVSAQNNKIRKLKRSMFSPQIWEINFSGNRLSSLPEDVFSDLPNLKRIHLSGNLFTEISEKVFRKVFRNLDMFNMDGNPLKCQCNIRWITLVTKPDECLGSCLEPKKLHGKQIRDLNIRDFVHCGPGIK